jgi:hypothetical protein
MILDFYSLPLSPLNLVRASHSFYSSKIYLNPTNYVGWLKPASKGCVKLVFDLDHKSIVRLSPMVLANPLNTKSFLLQGPVGFFLVNFRHFVKNVFRNEYSVTIFFFCGEFRQIFQKKIAKIYDNCLQFERVLKMSYYHILKITQFG